MQPLPPPPPPGPLTWGAGGAAPGGGGRDRRRSPAAAPAAAACARAPRPLVTLAIVPKMLNALLAPSSSNAGERCSGRLWAGQGWKRTSLRIQKKKACMHTLDL